jgi:TetR/AcrR family transcriptional regulator, transcriptional repressor for nem operon
MNDSKEHIIKIACKLFLQKSFKEVTMKELVKSTGLSKGAFYHYFESKEQLFLAVLEFFFSTVMIHHYENYSRESFYEFYHAYADEIKVYSQEYIVFLIGDEPEGEFNMNYFTLAFDALKLFPDFRARMIEEQNKELKIWTDVIGEARMKGEINSALSDEEIAKIYIYSSDGVAMHMVMRGTRIEDMVKPFMILWDRLYDQIKA